MKVIVVSGAHSDVGKTCLSNALCNLLPGAVRVKIGHHPRKTNVDDNYYNMGTTFESIASEHRNARFLVIESNSILNEITPDCAIYLSSENPKPSAVIAIKKADIIRGNPLPLSKISSLAKQLECDKSYIEEILELSGAFKQ